MGMHWVVLAAAGLVGVSGQVAGWLGGWSGRQ